MDGNYHKPTQYSFRKPQVADVAVDSGGKYGYDVGGDVVEFSAGATLKIGDVVYLSAANTVNKSLVAATVLGKIMGIVVGGKQTDMRACTRKLDVGLNAALVGEQVLVMFDGKYWTVSDAAITAGDPITTATVTTAGRVKTGTITTDVAAGDSGRLCGNALEAAGGAGITILIMIKMM